MRRVYIPSAGKFGTVTGSRSCGFLRAVTYLQVSVDGGETVSILQSDTIAADNVVMFPQRPGRSIRMPDGPGPSAA